MNMGSGRKKRWIHPCNEYGQVSAHCISSFVESKLQDTPNAGFHGVKEWLETFLFKKPSDHSSGSNSLQTLVWNEVAKLKGFFVTNATT